MFGQRRPDLLVERHLGHRGRLQRLDVRQRRVHGHLHLRPDAAVRAAASRRASPTARGVPRWACTQHRPASAAAAPVCAPGQTLCSGNGVADVQHQRAHGRNAPSGVLEPDLRDGQSCTGSCAPGQVTCSGNSTESCQSNGTFGNPAACTNTTCVAGVCSGSCAPGHDAVLGQRRPDVHRAAEPGARAVACSNQNLRDRRLHRAACAPGQVTLLGQHRRDVPVERHLRRAARVLQHDVRRGRVREAACTRQARRSARATASRVLRRHRQLGHRGRLHQPDVRGRRVYGYVRSQPDDLLRQRRPDVGNGSG